MRDQPSFHAADMIPLLDQVSDGIAVAAPGPWRLLYANHVLAEWIGKTAEELPGTPLESLFTPNSRAEVLALADLVCYGERTKTVTAARLQSDTAGCAADVRLCRITSADQALLGIVVRRRATDDPATAERRDPLTGLPDRDFLLCRLSALLHGGRTRDRQFAVLFVDLDNFKQVNDAHGHLMGDRVLREVARRLTGCVRECDHVVRFGGDEFVVLVEGASGPSEIEPIIGRIHAALEKPIALPEGEFTLSLSIGVAQASPDHHSPEELLHDADRAMYAAKRERNGAGTSPAGD